MNPMSSQRFVYFKNQKYEKIRNDCLRKGTLFEDNCFSLKVPKKKEPVDWVRPHDICDEPHFFVDGPSRFDVNQGSLSDCWLVTAMINLTQNEFLFKLVVPKDQSFIKDYCGIFRFRIWQCGEWTEVVVDDRLPTKENALIFMKSSDSSEFWSALLEKAYAKLYGGYDQLTGGWFSESMVDYTGGVVETLVIDPDYEPLKDIIFESYDKGSLLCVYMKNDPNTTEAKTEMGLVKGHAYSVTEIDDIVLKNNETVSLVRIRNPWGGKVEWKGDWSDSSKKWDLVEDEVKKDIMFVQKPDGEFWMCYDDFVDHFQFVDICHLGPSSFENEEGGAWTVHTFKGEWIKDVNAGGCHLETICMNPQYRVTVAKPTSDQQPKCTLVVALMQKNATRQIWHRIGLRMIKIDDEESVTGFLSKEYIVDKLDKTIKSRMSHTRETVHRHTWEPGVYYIIPLTHKPNEEGQFLLRVFSEKRLKVEEVEADTDFEQIGTGQSDVLAKPITTLLEGMSGLADATQGKHVPQLVYKSDQEVKAFFTRAAGNQSGLGWQGLQSLLQFALSPNQGMFTGSLDSRDMKFPKYECRHLIAMLDTDRSGKVDFDEFQSLWGKIRLWESAYLQHGSHSEYITAPVLRRALVASGYQVSSSSLGTMVTRYADDRGRFTFNDFVMCAIEMETS